MAAQELTPPLRIFAYNGRMTFAQKSNLFLIAAILFSQLASVLHVAGHFSDSEQAGYAVHSFSKTAHAHAGHSHDQADHSQHGQSVLDSDCVAYHIFAAAVYLGGGITGFSVVRDNGRFTNLTLTSAVLESTNTLRPIRAPPGFA